jgi:hypothetical protein
MAESPRSFAENPYCSVCYDERVEDATRGVAEYYDGLTWCMLGPWK